MRELVCLHFEYCLGKKVEVIPSCLTLCCLTLCSLMDYMVHGILQVRILE